MIFGFKHNLLLNLLNADNFYFVLLFSLYFRESFPNDLQFNILMRFTVDQTQTPSLKVKHLKSFEDIIMS